MSQNDLESFEQLESIYHPLAILYTELKIDRYRFCLKSSLFEIEFEDDDRYLIMDIDLENDLRRDDDDDDDDDETSDEEVKKDESENEDSKTNDVEKVMKKANETAKKKVARRPRPKLDVDRLTGPKGIEELCNLFKDEKFKGKGYEFDDLDTLMNKFKYWAHRLVPHMAFDDFIEKAENLGGKKPIKNALQHLRDKSNPNNVEELSHTLLDILPTIDPEPPSTDIPNDNELEELMQ